jgi:hypothetical protein
MIAIAAFAVAGAVCLTTGQAPGSLTAPARLHLASSSPRADTLHQRLFDGGTTFADFVAAAQRRKEQWEQHFAGAVVPDELVVRVTRAGATWKLLVITADGCSDSVNSVPYIAALAARSPNLDIRLVTADVGRGIMEAHRTPDGRAATPTVVLLDIAYAERGCWIERPLALRTWLDERKRTTGENDLFDAKMKWYDEEKGSKTLVEIVEMIEAAARGEVVCQ